MYYDKTSEDNIVTIRMVGNFTYHDKDKFIEMIDSIGSIPIAEIVLDFSFVEFIDSSAMGLLLLLRKELEKRNIKTRLSNVSGQVWKVINLSHFTKIFNVTPLDDIASEYPNKESS
jgi:HptB-dependent secretion and biofilm anti anti-sigma factor